MAKRIKSGLKRVEVAERNRQRNVAVKSSIKTATRKVLESLKDEEVLKKELPIAISKMDKAVSKGIVHKNTVARKKSRLMKRVNAEAKAKA
ncbi:MAG: 30S ribosomal protein S20 [Candidatus Sericytochromatia bacterium]|nr:30S ribosomal protein S20 [Candidatus Sericytochromatia bacterium]